MYSYIYGNVYEKNSYIYGNLYKTNFYIYGNLYEKNSYIYGNLYEKNSYIYGSYVKLKIQNYTCRKQKVCWDPRKLATMATTVLIVVHRYAKIKCSLCIIHYCGNKYRSSKSLSR